MVTGQVLIDTKISKPGIGRPDEMINHRTQCAAALTAQDRRIYV
jgi:hypothetical protein